MKKQTFSLNERTKIIGKGTRWPLKKRLPKFLRWKNKRAKKGQHSPPLRSVCGVKSCKQITKKITRRKHKKTPKKRGARVARAARYRPLQRGVRAERACKFYTQRCRKEADLCRTHTHRGVELTRTEVSNLHTEVSNLHTDVSWGLRTNKALANPWTIDDHGHAWEFVNFNGGQRSKFSEISQNPGCWIWTLCEECWNWSKTRIGSSSSPVSTSAPWRRKGTTRGTIIF